MEKLYLSKTFLKTACGRMHIPHPEMGIYCDNLSRIVIGNNFLSIIVITQNNCDLSITVIAFVIFFVIADKLSP